MHPVTLRTIASRAGVHLSTVSRILRDPNYASQHADSVRRIASELGYQPDWNAASLRTQRTKTIGVLVPRLTDLVLASVYDAAERAANEAHFETFVANTHDDPDEQRRRVDLLLSRRVDGLLIGDGHVDGANLDYLRERGKPFVLLNRTSEGALSVTADDQLGGRLVGTHIAAASHTRVGIITGPRHASTAVDRAEGCRSALIRAGLELESIETVSIGFDVAAGRVGAERLLGGERPPTAIFAVNDFAAIGVLGALRDRGLVPGADVAVIGYNDVPLAAELTVPLTTVNSPLEEMGRVGVEVLLELMAGGLPSSRVLEPRLVVRQSSPARFA